jgi:signal transduction histidine kinase
LRESEKRFQVLSSKLLNVQELERKAIALELHDGLLSDLAAVNLSLGAKIGTLEETGHPLAPDLHKLLKIHQRTMKETRRIMNRLRPSILDELGVIPAIQGLCREFGEVRPDIHVECKLEAKEDEIPNSIKVVIFRVVQEAVTNSVRHGKGTLAKISLRKFLGRIELIVQDNGQGFNLKNIQMGIGLQSMQERVEISGGEYQIESKIGQGTTIRATWSCS